VSAREGWAADTGNHGGYLRLRKGLKCSLTSSLVAPCPNLGKTLDLPSAHGCIVNFQGVDLLLFGKLIFIDADDHIEAVEHLDLHGADQANARRATGTRHRHGRGDFFLLFLERLIDRLLASPAYGERWGRHWLDVVRFGESTGFEQNIIWDNAWPFRDYVIRSWNEDKPFDRLDVNLIASVINFTYKMWLKISPI
jgi:hypothetical protein